ncbi:MAG: hypothetical protein ACHREM_27635, partial [Polyangiales bacterium]
MATPCPACGFLNRRSSGACMLCRHDLAKPAPIEPQLRGIRVPKGVAITSIAVAAAPVRASLPGASAPPVIAPPTLATATLGRSPQTELAETASRVVGAPRLFLDFTLASVAALDAWLDETWGVASHEH